MSLALTHSIKTGADSGGQTLYFLDVRLPDGKRRRTTHPSRADLENELAEIRAQIQLAGAHFASLTKLQRLDLIMVAKEALDLGTNVRELLAFWKAHRISLVNAKKVTLGQLVIETIQTSKAKNNRGRYNDNLEYVLSKFAAGREARPLSAITLSDIESWLADQKGRDGKSKASPSTIQGLRNRLSVMFSEAIRRSYIGQDENPMKKVICPKVDAKPVVFYRKAEVEPLLWVCRVTDPEFLPWLVLGLFAGVRPEELEKLQWSDIDFSRREILVDLFVGKVRQRRIIEARDMGAIGDLLFEWLHHWIAARGKVLPANCPDPNSYIVPVDADRRSPTLKEWELKKALKQVRQVVRRHRRRIAERAGVRWSNDVLRKTACTYLMALLDNENTVARILGNSPKIIHKHYRGLSRRNEVEDFCSLTPEVVRNDPIELPKGGIIKTDALPSGYDYKKRPGKLIP